MKSVLVTGAAGLLGKEVVSQLAELGIKVQALVRSKDDAFREDVDFIEMNLAEPINFSLIPTDIDTIFHLAQAREFREFPETASNVFQINLASTAELLDFGYKSGIKNFVYASSGGIYDGSAPQPIQENSALQRPENLGYYLASKFSSESLSLSYSSIFSVSVLRYFFIYGPEQARGMLIPRLFDSVNEGKEIALIGQNGMEINPVHVVDAAKATVAAGAKSETQIVNVAGPETISLRGICELFGKHLGKSPIFKLSENSGPNLIASTKKMEEELFPPVRRISESIQDITN